MTIFRLHHVQLAIPPGGEPTARAFFGDLLGLREVDKPPVLAARGGCWFASDGGLELHLGIEEPFRPAAKAHPGIEVDDLEALVERLRDAGHDVEPDGLLPGYRRVYVADPFGNRLEFLQPEPV